MSVHYYTLIERRGGVWSAQFGDYDRDVVSEEMADYKAAWNKAEAHRIIRTPADDPGAIVAEIAKRNGGAK